LGTLFLNSCLHELQKLNCYNHVLLKYFQVLELNLKFVIVFKKVQVFKNKWYVFANIWVFFQAPQYWCGEHSTTIFLVNGDFFIIKIIFNLPKSDVIVGDTSGVLFQVQKYDTNCFEKLEGG